MKLALITPEGAAKCLVCRWEFRTSGEKRVGKAKKVEATPEERALSLHKAIFQHLHSAHDRALLTREEVTPKAGEYGTKVYYHGRRPAREEV